MKKLLLSASALCALATLTVGSASAADMRMPVYRAAAPVVCPTCNWTGFYVGFNVGESKDWTSTQETWNWNYFYPANTQSTNTAPGVFSVGGAYNTGMGSTYRHASMGLIGGLQGGYNWQVGGLLVGFEGDWNWSNEKDTYTTGGSPVHFVDSFASVEPIIGVSGSSQGWTSEEKIDWLTTLRARLGWAHDCYLWYVTGGVAWAKIESNYTLVSTPGLSGSPYLTTGSPGLWGLPGGVAAANFSTTRTGWVLGGGVETDIGALFGLGGHSWSMKLEYLYVDLGSVNNTIGTNLVPVLTTVSSPQSLGLAVTGTATGTTSFTSQNHVYEQIIRVGINYRFGYAAAAPVVTKY